MASLSMLGMEARAFLCCLDGVGREVVTGENQRNSYVGSSLLITKTICDKKNLVDHAQDKLMLSCLLSVAMSKVLAAGLIPLVQHRWLVRYPKHLVSHLSFIYDAYQDPKRSQVSCIFFLLHTRI